MAEVEAKKVILKNLDGEYLIPITEPYIAGEGIKIEDNVISATRTETNENQAAHFCIPDYNAGVSWTTTKGNIWTASYNYYLNVSLDQGSKFVVKKDGPNGVYLTYQWNDLGQTNSNNLIIPKGLKLYVVELLIAHESNVIIYPFIGDDND